MNGFDPDRLDEVLRGFAADKANFHGLLVERRGVVVAEAYKRGRDKSPWSPFRHSVAFDAGTRHDMRSISRTITGLLWGIAHGQGLLPALETPVASLYPELRKLARRRRGLITIRHLLTMTCGLSWNETRAANALNDELRLYWRAPAPYLFHRRLASPPGMRFNHNAGCTAVLGQILARHTGMTLPEYARAQLFEPLGITDWRWDKDLRGRPLAFSGLHMLPADLARLGRMVLRQGQWQGRAIVPADWLAEATRAHIDTGDGRQYGYHWWLGKVEALGAKQRWHAAFGNGGQRLYLVPALDLVVVMTAGDYNKAEIGPQCGQLLKRVAAAIVD